jgi:hypothetical protein
MICLNCGTLDDGGRLSPKAVERGDRLAMLVPFSRRFPVMNAIDSRSQRSSSYAFCPSFYLIPFPSRFLGDVRAGR